MDKLSKFPKHTIEATGPKKEPQTSESRLQAKCVEDMRGYYPEENDYFFAINNNSESALKGAMNKAVGTLEGVADTAYLKDFGTVIWIEFKKPVPGSRQSKCQIKWQSKVEARGHEYVVCKDYHHFWEIVGLKCPEPGFVFINK